MLKRIFDFCLALMGLFFFLPLLGLIYLILLLEEGKPIFYFKKSLGRDGRVFNAIKFRSMVISSSEITKLGKILRQTAMDELPQLINIVKGELSFVGPRNYGVDKYKRADANFLRRLKITPGLTGLAQVFTSKNASNEEVLKWDFKYIESRNFFIDLWIILISIWITMNRKWERLDRKI